MFRWPKDSMTGKPYVFNGYKQGDIACLVYLE